MGSYSYPPLDRGRDLRLAVQLADSDINRRYRVGRSRVQRRVYGTWALSEDRSSICFDLTLWRVADCPPPLDTVRRLGSDCHLCRQSAHYCVDADIRRKEASIRNEMDFWTDACSGHLWFRPRGYNKMELDWVERHCCRIWYIGL